MKKRLNALVSQLFGWSYQPTKTTLRRTSWAVSLACVAAGIGGAQGLAQAQRLNGAVDLAQTYDVTPPPPDGAIPVPSYGAMPPSTTSNQNFTGQQYVVFVSGNSDALLEQVRLVEPTAFRTNFQGQTVIQAGRFNSPENANERLNQLTIQGIGGNITEVAAAAPYYAQSPVQSPGVYATNGDLPPVPTTAVPQVSQASPTDQPVPGLPAIPATPVGPADSGMTAGPETVPQGSVEFGQELAYSVPPSPGSYPVNTTPPGTAAAAPPTSARVSAPYYVIIPTPERNLPEVSAEIIQLGTPADRVQQRLSPRGPHVAVGPFEDRGLAFQWNQFYRDAGIGNSRVHYDP